MTAFRFGGLAAGGARMLCVALALQCWFAAASLAHAHNVTAGDAGYIQEIWGVHLIPFAYLGAKHMVTGYDHILFLLGVVFFVTARLMPPAVMGADLR